jgi:preprotein translocase subunit SecA
MGTDIGKGSLYEQWKKLMDGQTRSTFPAFWDKYSDTEKRIYGSILEEPRTVSGSFRELAAAWEAEDLYFMGFLDGVATSLREGIDLESVTADSALSLDIDIEKLYFNMRAAKAEHLYGLPQWEKLLSEERRAEITKEQRRAGTVTKGDVPGRNDPCPCGSGKKYKKCCGAEAV